MYAAALTPRWEEGVSPEHTLKLDASTTSVVLGRGTALGIEDLTVSRKQALAEFAADTGVLTVTVTGPNKSTYYASRVNAGVGSSGVVLSKGESAELRSGDVFALGADKFLLDVKIEAVGAGNKRQRSPVVMETLILPDSLGEQGDDDADDEPDAKRQRVSGPSAAATNGVSKANNTTTSSSTSGVKPLASVAPRGLSVTPISSPTAARGAGGSGGADSGGNGPAGLTRCASSSGSLRRGQSLSLAELVLPKLARKGDGSFENEDDAALAKAIAESDAQLAAAAAPATDADEELARKIQEEMEAEARAERERIEKADAEFAAKLAAAEQATSGTSQAKATAATTTTTTASAASTNTAATGVVASAPPPSPPGSPAATFTTTSTGTGAGAANAAAATTTTTATSTAGTAGSGQAQGQGQAQSPANALADLTELPMPAQGYILDEIPLNSPAAADIVADFTACGFTVSKVEKIRNPLFATTMAMGAKLMMAEAQQQGRTFGFLLNERYLYHYSRAPTDDICSMGLDLRYARGGFFGSGIYMSDTPEKCNLYAGFRDGTKIYRVRALLGTSKYYPPGSTDGTLRVPPKGFDSVEGSNTDGRNLSEFIVYNNMYAIPEYIITYKGRYVGLMGGAGGARQDSPPPEKRRPANAIALVKQLIQLLPDLSLDVATEALQDAEWDLGAAIDQLCRNAP